MQHYSRTPWAWTSSTLCNERRKVKCNVWPAKETHNQLTIGSGYVCACVQRLRSTVANEDCAAISTTSTWLATGRGKVISKWNFIASSQMLTRLVIIDSIQIAGFTSHSHLRYGAEWVRSVCVSGEAVPLATGYCHQTRQCIEGGEHHCTTTTQKRKRNRYSGT